MELLVEQKRRVLHLTLNRPEKRNALTSGMCSGIVQAVETAQAGYDTGVVLISANGHVFCAGMDLDEAVTIDHHELARVHDRLFTMGFWSRKPIIVAVNGAALGGGLGLVAQGHVVTASNGAAFGFTEIKIGLWPFLIYRSVEAALGPRRTLQLSLTGQLFYAQQALEWGLVHNVSTPVEVLDRACGYAVDMAKSSPEAIQHGLEFVQASRGKSPDETGAIAQNLRARLMEGHDFQEGFRSFKLKQQPRWPSMPPDFYEASGRGEFGRLGKVTGGPAK